MRPLLRGAWMTLFLAFLAVLVRAQDLAPRAYVITPLHSNAVILNYGFYDGVSYSKQDAQINS
jgi:hypothetical protein